MMDNLLQMIANPKAHLEFVNKLPPKIKARTRALQGLEEEHKTLTTAHDAELKELEKKYAALYTPLYNERKEIVAGKAALTEEQLEKGKAYLLHKAEKAEDSDDEDAPAEKPDIKATLTAEVSKGIPEFWLTALTNHPIWSEIMIHSWDQPILKHLSDIESHDEPQGFRLTFHFSENEFFENRSLTKTYKVVNTEMDIDDVEQIIGDDIKWKDGKNVTKKKAGKKIRPQESFFTFFNSLVDEDKMQDDFELASSLKEQIIPRAVEWFCDEFADDEEEEEEEDEEDEEEDDDDDDDAGKKSNSKGDKEKNEECKQQ
ncbi:putative nucleosome assembly protein [Diplonema papillatum]|nr:putative nucleosome assembly protein [Diplonema papillatum]